MSNDYANICIQSHGGICFHPLDCHLFISIHFFTRMCVLWLSCRCGGCVCGCCVLCVSRLSSSRVSCVASVLWLSCLVRLSCGLVVCVLSLCFLSVLVCVCLFLSRLVVCVCVFSIFWNSCILACLDAHAVLVHLHALLCVVRSFVDVNPMDGRISRIV